MPGWIVQWYAYVPGVWNVNANCPPAGSDPEFQPLASDVVVCATVSVFIHVTVEPTATLRLSGV